MSKANNEGWEERFDKFFPWRQSRSHNGSEINITRQDILDFIAEERRAVVEEAINLVSGMQFSLGGLGGTEGGMHYNRAITNVVSKLEALKTF